MNRFAVIIATHQRPHGLKRAVQSVKAQSYPSVDVIVVADALCEATQALVLPLLGPDDLFIQRLGRPGPARSRTLGIEVLKADYAIFLDDDDELSKDYVRDIDLMRPETKSGVVYCDFSVANYRADEDRPTVSTHSLAANAVDTLHIKNFIPNSCLVFPAEILKGRQFDETLELNEDWDFILNVLNAAPFVHVTVQGPIIHKTQTPRRGNSSDHLLVENYRQIYEKWPAPSTDLKRARQSLLAGSGIDLPLSRL